MTLRDSLRATTTVVIDTADIDAIAKYSRKTDHQSLSAAKAAQKPAYKTWIDDALRWPRGAPPTATRARRSSTRCWLSFGCEILELVRALRRAASTSNEALVRRDLGGTAPQLEDLAAEAHQQRVDERRARVAVGGAPRGSERVVNQVLVRGLLRRLEQQRDWWSRLAACTSRSRRFGGVDDDRRVAPQRIE